MKIEYIASSVGRAAPHQFLSSFIINDTIAVDAGAIGLLSPPERQKQVRHVVLTHTHIDHLATLPLFLDMVYDPQQPCVTIHASEEVQDCLRADVFNDRLWPDLIASSEESVSKNWFRDGAEVVIECGFIGFLGAETVRFSGDQF